MGNISIRSFAAAVTVYIILISDEVLSSCNPKCDSEHCCVNGRCEKRLELGQSCNPTDIKNGNACPCRIGYVCIQDNNEHKCHDHSETATASSFEGHGRPCLPKCDYTQYCCVNGQCQNRLSEGQSCNPTDIHSGHACPCRIGFICTEENNEFRCKNHLQAGAGSSATSSTVAHSESTAPGTTLRPTTAPPSTTTVSHTITTSTPITTTTTTTTTPRPITTTTTTTTPRPTTTRTTTSTTSTTTPTPSVFTSPSISRNVPHSTPSFSTPSLKDSTTPHVRLPGSTAHNQEPYSPTESDPWGTSGHPTSRQQPYSRQTRPPRRSLNNGNRT